MGLGFVAVENKRNNHQDNRTESAPPLIRPSEEMWKFCVEVGQKYGFEPLQVYGVLEMKALLFGKCDEKGARILIDNGEVSVEVDFYKTLRENSKPVAP
jgi:hypothetical protein